MPTGGGTGTGFKTAAATIPGGEQPAEREHAEELTTEGLDKTRPGKGRRPGTPQLVRQLQACVVDFDALHSAGAVWSSLIAQAQDEIRRLRKTQTSENALMAGTTCQRILGRGPAGEIRHEGTQGVDTPEQLADAWQAYGQACDGLQTWQSTHETLFDPIEPAVMLAHLDNLKMVSKAMEHASVNLKKELLDEMKRLVGILSDRLRTGGAGHE